MLIKILIGVVIVIVLLVVLVATRPTAFHIERSITIAAPAERCFDHVNDFGAWRAWSPWEKLDPDLKRTYGGPGSGVGSTYAWVGNKKVGEGRMAIERSERPSVIAIKLEFIKPWTATNVATFTFAPAAGGTKLTWAMDGKNNFAAKAFGLVMNFDKMVGGDFERGLSSIKALAESDAKPIGAVARAGE